MAKVPNPSLLLFDNGSLRPEPTLRLRRIAGQLAARLNRPVIPTSLLHSDRVDSAGLEGQSASLLEMEIKRHLATGQSSFVLLPFFIAPSGALTDYLPRRLADLRQRHPPIRAVVADSLARLDPDPDLRLTEILADRVTGIMANQEGDRPEVIVVDHGSPVRQVALVRDRIADRLAERLGSTVQSVRAASMERPDGDAYAFNDPLLDRALATLPGGGGPVIVSQLFLAPGRHAGPNGDIATICQAAGTSRPGLSITITDPIGTHPVIIDILADRAQEAIETLEAERSQREL